MSEISRDLEFFNFIERNDQMNHEFKCHWIQVIKSVYMTHLVMYFYGNEDV